MNIQYIYLHGKIVLFMGCMNVECQEEIELLQIIQRFESFCFFHIMSTFQPTSTFSL